MRSLGYTDADLADGGSDRLIDALVDHADAGTVAASVTEHLDAGADHVAVQLLTSAGEDPVAGFTTLAKALLGCVTASRRPATQTQASRSGHALPSTRAAAGLMSRRLTTSSEDRPSRFG